jgi:two-component system response regulator YesN
MSLPDVSGIESLRKIQEIKPDIRCFLMSGFSVAQIAKRAAELGVLDILTKPFDPENLSQQLFTARRQGP